MNPPPCHGHTALYYTDTPTARTQARNLCAASRKCHCPVGAFGVNLRAVPVQHLDKQ